MGYLPRGILASEISTTQSTRMAWAIYLVDYLSPRYPPRRLPETRGLSTSWITCSPMANGRKKRPPFLYRPKRRFCRPARRSRDNFLPQEGFCRPAWRFRAGTGGGDPRHQIEHGIGKKKHFCSSYRARLGGGGRPPQFLARNATRGGNTRQEAGNTPKNAAQGDKTTTREKHMFCFLYGARSGSVHESKANLHVGGMEGGGGDHRHRAFV